MGDKDNKESKPRSGGPRSRDGKASAAQNALRHGLTALKPRLLEWESTAQFQALAAALIEELKPEGVMEAILVDRIVWCSWRLRRAARVEQLLLTGGSFETTPQIIMWVDPDETPAKLPRLSAKEVEREREIRESAAMVQYGCDASNLTRYETTLERSLYRALWELREMQSLRRRGRRRRKEAAAGIQACCLRKLHSGSGQNAFRRPSRAAWRGRTLFDVELREFTLRIVLYPFEGKLIPPSTRIACAGERFISGVLNKPHRVAAKAVFCHSTGLIASSQEQFHGAHSYGGLHLCARVSPTPPAASLLFVSQNGSAPASALTGSCRWRPGTARVPARSQRGVHRPACRQERS
jgi:hypothetical protein